MWLERMAVRDGCEGWLFVVVRMEGKKWRWTERNSRASDQIRQLREVPACANHAPAAR